MTLVSFVHVDETLTDQVSMVSSNEGTEILLGACFMLGLDLVGVTRLNAEVLVLDLFVLLGRELSDPE